MESTKGGLSRLLFLCFDIEILFLKLSEGEGGSEKVKWEGNSLYPL